MFFNVGLAALAAASTLLSQASGHMIMATPKPFGNPDNSPLSPAGSNFPCKYTGSNPQSFYSGVTNPPMAAGSTQTLSFTGSAIHGGGSCQVAITTDKAPTASTSWQVILSIEGGCPGITSPSTFKYTIPESTKAGDYVLAWTWISKEAGQPEYYMNCAPITVTGGGSGGGNATKRSEEEDFGMLKRQNSLPELFVANVGINNCKTSPGTDPVYPDPGPTVQKPNSNANYAPITQTGCVPKGAQDNPSGGSGGGSSSAAGAGPSAAPSSGSGSGSGSSSAAGAAPSGSGSGSGSESSSAAGAAPSGGSGSGSMTTVASASSSVVATPISTPEASSASAAAPSEAPSAASSAAPSVAGSSPPASSGSTSGGLSGACTTEGMWNCIGGNSFQRCASGQWSPVTPMASGTSCTPGQSQDFTIGKREYLAPRFPGLRRHREILKNINV